jgi:rsbT co-antagonist protein RsbR
MKSGTSSQIAKVLQEQESALLAGWTEAQLSSSTLRADLLKESELREDSRQFLTLFQQAAQKGDTENMKGAEWERLREFLHRLSSSRAQKGFSPTETATFVLSLKEPLFGALREQFKNDPQGFADDIWRATLVLDGLGLYTADSYQKSRESVISRQQAELLELSTPVVQLWDQILALPLVGTLDSSRTQVVMESLLEKIVETGAAIAIIDITGVPTVDTLVAQHLLKTIAATRLMGADCVISGIRPQIAQTIVHLGVNLGDVITKATLADALAIALDRVGMKVVKSTDH